MADSGTVRTEWWRRHRAGDHSLCKPANCRKSARAVVRVVPASAMPGLDRDAELVALIQRLIAVHVADPANAAVARELRAALLCSPDTGDDPVADLQRRVADKRAAVLRRGAGDEPAG